MQESDEAGFLKKNHNGAIFGKKCHFWPKNEVFCNFLKKKSLLFFINGIEWKIIWLSTKESWSRVREKSGCRVTAKVSRPIRSQDSLLGYISCLDCFHELKFCMLMQNHNIWDMVVNKFWAWPDIPGHAHFYYLA